MALQTKTITANGSKGHHKFSLKVNEDSTSSNSSFISFAFTLAPIQTGWDWNWSGQPEKISYEVKIGDKTYTGTIPIYDGSSTITIAGEGGIEIPHEDDGTKTITISFSVTDTTGANYTCGNASNSGTMPLTTIPRATACPNLDGYIESSAPISLNSASTSFKHRLYYSYNGKTGYYPSSTTFFANTGSLSLDTSFYSYTPKSSGTGTITLYTYDSSGNLIGTKTGTITIRCDKDKCRPVIEATVVDNNETTIALTGDKTKLIKGFSNAQITYTIEVLNSATLKSKTVNGSTLGTSPHTISKVSTGIFNILAIDSRDFDTTETKTNTLIDYIPLTLDFNAFRPTPTGSEIKVNFKGNYFNDTFGAVDNTLELSWKYRIKGASTWIDGGTFVKDTDYRISNNKFTSIDDISLSDTLFDYQTNYEIAIYYADKLIDTATIKTVPKGKPVLNWEDELVNVNGKLTVNDVDIVPKNKLCAYLTVNATVTTTDSQYGIIPLDQYEVVGDKLTFNSSYLGIVIGEGVSKISVKASIFFKRETSPTNVGIAIAKNGTVVAENINTKYSEERTYDSMNLDVPVMSVSKGNVLTLVIRSVATVNKSMSIYKGIGCTQLAVEVIEES